MLKRMFKAIREPVNGLTHLGAAVVSAVGLAALLITGRSTIGKEVSLLIYGSTLVMLFAASATYHLVQGSPRVMGILRKVDHAAIYLLIPGSYTPFCYNMFSGFWQWGLLAIVWSLAFLGVTLKVFKPDILSSSNILMRRHTSPVNRSPPASYRFIERCCCRWRVKVSREAARVCGHLPRKGPVSVIRPEPGNSVT